MRRLALFFLTIASFLPAWSQQRVDAGNSYHRVLAIVPVIGQGSGTDPKRPMFIPAVHSPTDRAGIIAFQFQLSDDGTQALVEFVAADRGAINGILHSNDPRVKAFEVGKSTRQEIETEFKKHKKNFSFDNFHPVRLP
jgi:hypothetical protein